ncbi:alpha/beta hydrolase [Pleionea sediminis]|uniref:alpha/beta hydrolase n=1 Tax=Pleionea sediminis TaxID=2569479 RepID=UPI0011871F20|nr:alpha/beta hydrolase [Pleionea sediminis]
MIVRYSLLFILFMIMGCTSKPSLDSVKKEVAEYFKARGSCYASRLTMDPLQHQPVYSNNSSSLSCEEKSLDEITSAVTLFSDNRCTKPFKFNPTTVKEFCDELMADERDYLGNAASWYWREDEWTLQPSSRLDFNLISTKNNLQPFMLRKRYKNVASYDEYASFNEQKKLVLRGLGECQLEMRVYKNDVKATGLKSLIIYHGGGWAFRGTGIAAVESAISHFTKRGYVVYLPFYRLAGEHDGNYECNGSYWREITSDAYDAYSWVKDNASEYGSDSGSIDLLGGSAGAFLAIWLSVYHPESINKVGAFYGPTDFKYYAQQAKLSPGLLKGEKIMRRFLDEDVQTISEESEAIVSNTLTEIVVNAPRNYPEYFLLHGVSDTLVPSDQSVRFCNALSGNIEQGPAENFGGNPEEGEYRKIYHCSNRNQLHLFAEAEHTFDFCIQGLECNAGSKQSQKVIRESMQQLFDWFSS